MLSIALVHNHYDQEHLAEVKAAMLELGAPKIKAIWMECYNMYAALEGCHRIRAAKELGLIPEIVELDYNDVCDLDVTDPMLGLDLDNPGSTVAWLVDDCYRRVCIDFKEDDDD